VLGFSETEHETAAVPAWFFGGCAANFSVVDNFHFLLCRRLKSHCRPPVLLIAKGHEIDFVQPTTTMSTLQTILLSLRGSCTTRFARFTSCRHRRNRMKSFAGRFRERRLNLSDVHATRSLSPEYGSTAKNNSNASETEWKKVLSLTITYLRVFF